jgi:hypothetical protein
LRKKQAMIELKKKIEKTIEEREKEADEMKK